MPLRFNDFQPQLVFHGCLLRPVDLCDLASWIAQIAGKAGTGYLGAGQSKNDLGEDGFSSMPNDLCPLA